MAPTNTGSGRSVFVIERSIAGRPAITTGGRRRRTGGGGGGGGVTVTVALSSFESISPALALAVLVTEPLLRSAWVIA